MTDETLWPVSIEREAPFDLDPAQRIQPEDIANYAYPPGRRERYTETGFKKAQALGIAPLDVRDFGASPDNSNPDQPA